MLQIGESLETYMDMLACAFASTHVCVCKYQVYAHVCACVRACVRACVCVCERERERERERDCVCIGKVIS